LRATFGRDRHQPGPPLKEQPDVLALSYHVDYWDYLGWRDTLGSPECSQRQYDYAKSRGDKNVYTPQTVINGGKHFVGSQRASISSGIDAARSEDEMTGSIWNDRQQHRCLDHHSSRQPREGSNPVASGFCSRGINGNQEGRECREHDRLLQCRAQIGACRDVAWRGGKDRAAQGERGSRDL
jgi:hypothetical protein